MSKLKGLGKIAADEFTGFMDGYCDAFDDLPDGAWQSCCMEGVESFNEVNKTRIDPHDGWMFWLENRK
jgi:hypothetical protein